MLPRDDLKVRIAELLAEALEEAEGQMLDGDAEVDFLADAVVDEVLAEMDDEDLNDIIARPTSKEEEGEEAG